MKFAKQKKIFFIIVLTAFVVLLLGSNTVIAEVNTSYSGTDAVPEDNLSESVAGSVLLDLLARLVYALGRFFEWILGIIFKLLTGRSDFPWADKIVFNAVPLLDINFINPALDSFVGQSSISEAIRSLYATIMTLSISFFGVVVLITAIKLVISTIASEKAKYKQAIVDWLVGFVLLFCIHYFISFVFYLNEQLVTVASNIVTSQLEDANAIAEVGLSSLAKEVVAGARSSGVKYNGKLVADILEENPDILYAWISENQEDKTRGLHEAMMKELKFAGFWDESKATDEQYRNLGMIISWAARVNVSVDRLKEIRNDIKYYGASEMPTLIEEVKIYGFNQAIKRGTVQEMFTNSKIRPDTEGIKMFFDFMDALGVTESYVAWGTGKYVEGVCDVTYDALTGTIPVLVTARKEPILTIDINDYDLYLLSLGAGEIRSDVADDPPFIVTTFNWTQVLDDMISLKNASDTRYGELIENSAGGRNRLITDLASYFRENAYVKKVDEGAVTAVVNDGEKIQIQNMLMYAILVVQSLILFISYIKRLFYVMLLAMMAPVVVVFDFFQKFGK